MTGRQPPPHITLEHYRYIIDSIDEAVFALEMDGNVSYLNPSAEKRLAVDLNERRLGRVCSQRLVRASRDTAFAANTAGLVVPEFLYTIHIIVPHLSNHAARDI